MSVLTKLLKPIKASVVVASSLVQGVARASDSLDSKLESSDYAYLRAVGADSAGSLKSALRASEATDVLSDNAAEYYDSVSDFFTESSTKPRAKVVGYGSLSGK